MGRLIALLLLGAGGLFAQPLIYYRGIVSAATYHPSGVAAGALARGSIFTIFGRNLGPAEPQQVSAFPLPATLAGVSIQVRQGATTRDALPLFVLNTQINAILPSNTPTGLVSIRVTYNGQAGNWSPVNVVDSNPGLFAYYSNGSGPGVIQNFLTQAEQPVNSTKVTARPGQVITLWATGLGPIDAPDNAAPPAGDLPVPVTIWVGDKEASKLYAGRAPCCSGLDQIVVKIPDDAPSGCFVPVRMSAGGRVSNTVTMAIHPNGAPCEDPNPAIAALLRGGKTGYLLARRVDMLVDVDPSPAYTEITELLGAAFRDEPARDWYNNFVFMRPPVGSCTTYTFSGDLLRGNSLPLPASLGHIDAGQNLEMASPNGPLQLPLVGDPADAFGGFIGYSFYGKVVQPLNFTQPGAIQIKGNGAGTGTLEATLKIHSPLTWTNRDQIANVASGGPLAVTWSGAPTSHTVLIFGVSVSVIHNATGMFLCAADPAAGSFVVPPHVTANLPPAVSFGSDADAILMVGSTPAAGSGSVTAPALDGGFVSYTSWRGRTIGVK